MILAFAPRYDSPGRRDVAGAFAPESRAFCRVHGAPPPEVFDNRASMPERLAFVRGRIEACPPGELETLAIFSHGWKDGLQIGVRLGTARKLAESIASIAAPSMRVLLYCCDAARDADDERVDDTQPGPGGDGGMADKIRDELRIAGIAATIYAHSTAGHTTKNPYVRRFDAGEMAGGHWVIEPRSPLWVAWRKALQDGTLRFRFPFMNPLEIDAELYGDTA